MRRIVVIVSILVVVLFAAGFGLHLLSQEKTAAAAGPHYASLRNAEANMRTGPGTRYPIAWVYKYQGLPVEILGKDDEDIWRHVRDSDGATGWIHKNELSSKRSAIVTGGPHDLLTARDDAAPPAAHLEAGAVGRLLSCEKDWCRLEFTGAKGYLRKDEFWGAYADETFD